jgi:UDP-N-acetylglucosamine 3-dehydrogenase
LANSSVSKAVTTIGEPLRFAVIGTGTMGSLRLRILGQRTDVTLEAIADVSPERLEKARQPSGAEQAYTDFRKMFAAQRFDAVVVATPDEAHLEPCLAALKAGAHLFVEKPLARTADDADAIVAAAQAAGRVLAVGHTLRFDTAYVFARDLVLSGKLGRIVHGYARRNGSLDDGWPGDRDRVQGVDPTTPLKRSSLAHYLMIHDIDVVHWITGIQHSRVRGARLPTDLSLGLGGVVALTEGPDGSAVVFESSWVRPAGPSNRTSIMLEIIGTEGMVEIIGGQAVHYWRNGEYEHPRVASYSFSEPSVYGDEIEDFVQAIRNNRAPLCPGRDGAYAVRVADAILAASADTPLLTSSRDDAQPDFPSA